MDKFTKIVLLLILGCLVSCAPRIAIRPDYDLTKIKRVTVLPFEPRGSYWSHFYTDYFISELIRIGKFDVIEKARLDKVLVAQMIDKDTPIDFTLLQEISKALNVDAVFIGSCVRGVSRGVVNVRMIELQTGKIIWSGMSSDMRRLVKTLR